MSNYRSDVFFRDKSMDGVPFKKSTLLAFVSGGNFFEKKKENCLRQKKRIKHPITSIDVRMYIITY